MLENSPISQTSSFTSENFRSLCEAQASDEVLLKLIQEHDESSIQDEDSLDSHLENLKVLRCMKIAMQHDRMSLFESMIDMLKTQLDLTLKEELFRLAISLHKLEGLQILLKTYAYDRDANIEKIQVPVIYRNNSYLKTFSQRKGGQEVPDKLFLVAVVSGQVDMVQYLVENFVKTKDDSQALESLHRAYLLACCHGHKSVVEYFVNHTQVNAAVESSEALKLACLNGNLELVDYLLSVEGIDAAAKQSQALRLVATLMFSVDYYKGILLSGLQTENFIKNAPSIINRLLAASNRHKKNVFVQSLSYFVENDTSPSRFELSFTQSQIDDVLASLFGYCKKHGINPYHFLTKKKGVHYSLNRLQHLMKPDFVDLVETWKPDIFNTLMNYASVHLVDRPQCVLPKLIAFFKVRSRVELLINYDSEMIKPAIYGVVRAMCYLGYDEILKRLFEYEAQHYGRLLTYEQLQYCMSEAVRQKHNDIVLRLLIDKQVSLTNTALELPVLMLALDKDDDRIVRQVKNFYKYANKNVFAKVVLSAVMRDSIRCFFTLLRNNKSWVNNDLVNAVVSCSFKHDSVQIVGWLCSHRDLSSVSTFFRPLNRRCNLLGVAVYWSSVKVFDCLLKKYPHLADNEIKGSHVLLSIALASYVSELEPYTQSLPFFLRSSDYDPALVCPKSFKIIVELLKTPGQWDLLKNIISGNVDNPVVSFSDRAIRNLEYLVEFIGQQRWELYSALDVLHQVGLQASEYSLPQELMAELLRDYNGLARHHIGQELYMPLYGRYLKNRAHYALAEGNVQSSEAAMDLDVDASSQAQPQGGIKRKNNESQDLNPSLLKRFKGT